MRKLIAAIALTFLSACASQAPYRHAESTGAYVAAGPAFYDWPLVYQMRMFPGWYGGYPYYAYWGFPSPWGFYYYSPYFYPYHFSVAYSLWPDFYGGWYYPPVPWRPPYHGHWHPHSAGVPAPVADGSPAAPGAYGIGATYPTRVPGRPIHASGAIKSTSGGGLDGLYQKGTAYYGRSASGSYPGKRGSAFPPPSRSGPAFAPPPAMPAAPAAPAVRSMSPARARNPSGRPVNPAKPVWQKD